MGLDQYLTAKKYLSSYNKKDAKLSEQISKKCSELSGGLTVSEIVFSVAYWRKSNQIHNWFVNNVQDGEDDCKEYYVSVEKLTELYKTVLDVLEDNSKAMELLPPKEGFFFGSYDIDEYYLQQLENTKSQLEPVLQTVNEQIKENKFTALDFYYRASW